MRLNRTGCKPGAVHVYMERHWATDAVGGWGLGLAAAALAALWYERERDAAEHWGRLGRSG